MSPLTPYAALIRHNAQRVFVSPLWIATNVFGLNAITIALTLLFWQLVAQSGGSFASTREMLGYFLVALAFAELTLSNLSVAGLMNNRVRTGAIARILLRPARFIPAMIIETGVVHLAEITFGLVLLVAGCIVIAPSLPGMILAVPAYLCALVISLAINLSILGFALQIGSAGTIRWSLATLIRFLSGAMIPIALFPPTMRSVLSYSPFPALVSGPTLALRATAMNTESLLPILVAACWAVFLWLVSTWFLRSSLRTYDAAGI